MSKKERLVEYKNKLADHLIASKENKLYALKRLDIMIVALSSGGIYLGIELIKLPYEILPKSLFVIPSLIFSLAIIANIISQWTGYKSNTYESEWIDLELESCQSKKRKKSNKELQGKLDCKVQHYNKVTSFFNGSSSILLIFGIVFLGIIVFLLFWSWV